jgi:hypothetical protein
MENQDSNPQLIIDEEAKKYLNESRRWAKFLSIVGFVGIGLIVLIFVFMIFLSPQNSSNIDDFVLTDGLFGIVYLLMASLYFPPIYYMHKFSKLMKQAVENDDNESITVAFKYLKSQFKFYGIFTISFLVIYAIMLLTMGGTLLLR